MPNATLHKLPSHANLARLREAITAIEHGGNPAYPRNPADNLRQGDSILRFGVTEIDRALPGGGLACGAVHEISGARSTAANPNAENTAFAAASGFAAAIAGRAASSGETILWCSRANSLYAPGLATFGLDTARLIIVRAPRPEDAAWVAEEALRAGIRAVIAETSCDLTASRRLQLAARTHGSLCLLLQQPHAAAIAATTRWRITPAPGTPRPGNAPGAAHWRLSLTRCRGGSPRNWTVKWCHETHRFTLDALVAHRTVPAAPARRRQTA